MRKSIKTNALLNMVKQVMQIIFPVITIPYVTRVLLPENYGKINTGSSLISYIGLIAGLGISTYAIREGSSIRDNRKQLNAFSNQVFSINVISTLISYIILAIIILFVPHYKEYRLLLLIQGSGVLFTTLGVDWVNSIEEDYLYLTIRYIILHIISLVLLFIFVKTPDDYYIYAIISLITSVGANLMNIIYVRKYIKIRFTFDIDWKTHLIPIMILFGNSVAMTVYVSSDVTMLEIFKGATEVGIYSVSTKVYSIIKLILNAILVVSIPRMTAYAANKQQRDFEGLGEKILSALITLMLPLITGIVIFREEAIIVAGGNKYLEGVGSLSILTLAVTPAMLATFFSGSVLMPLHKEKYLLKGTVISACLNVGLNFIFIPLWGSNGAAITTFVSETFIAAYFLFLIRKEGYHFFDKKNLCLSLTGVGFVVITSLFVKSLFNNYLLRLGLSIILSGSIYGIIQIFGKNKVVLELLPWIKKKKNG